MEKLTFKCEKLTTLAMTHFYGRTQIADSRAAPFAAKKIPFLGLDIVERPV